jgi:hypothetical protein
MASAHAAAVPGAVEPVGPGSAHIRSDPSIAVDRHNGRTLSIAYNEQPSSGQPFRPRVATSLDSGTTWSIVSSLPVPTGQHYVNTTSLAAFGNGRLVAAYLVVGTYTLGTARRDLSSVIATSSADNGRTWGAPTYLFHAQLSASGACSASDSLRSADVGVAVDPREVLHRAYVAWLSDDGCLGQPSRYHLARTNDNGRTWTPGAAWQPDSFIKQTGTVILDLFPPQVTVGPSGYVYVGYTGVYSSPGMCPGAGGGSASTSVMARSPDAGQSVASNFMLSSCDGFGVPRTTIDPRTRALVAVLDNGSRIRVLRSTDSGIHWQDPPATQPVPAAVRSPSLTATPDGHITLVGVVGTTCRPELFRSADDGGTWATPRMVSTNADALCPQDTQTAIASGTNNVIHPVWAERAPLSQGGSALWTAGRKSTTAA